MLDEVALAPPLTALLDVDRLIHEPARFVLMAHLHALEEADFVYIQRQTGMTAGNISSHVQKLEQAAYVKVKKTFAGRRPQTILSLTRKGRRALDTYLATMGSALEAMEER